MRRLLFAPLAALLLVPAARAADAFDLAVANFVILQDKRIQKEVGVTAAQRTKLNAIAAADAARRKGIVMAAQKAGKISDAQKKALSDSVMRLRSEVLGTLAPAQLKRLREITIQSAGAAALLDPTVGKRVGITGDQRKRMVAIFDGARKAAFDLRQRSVGPIAAKYQAMKPKSAAEAQKIRSDFEAEAAPVAKRIAPELARISADAAKRMIGVATPAQRKALEGLKGKPFRPA